MSFNEWPNIVLNINSSLLPICQFLFTFSFSSSLGLILIFYFLQNSNIVWVNRKLNRTNSEQINQLIDQIIGRWNENEAPSFSSSSSSSCCFTNLLLMFNRWTLCVCVLPHGIMGPITVSCFQFFCLVIFHRLYSTALFITILLTVSLLETNHSDCHRTWLISQVRSPYIWERFLSFLMTFHSEDKTVPHHFENPASNNILK